MQNFNPMIAYHAKNDHGWEEICRYPLNSPKWSAQDRTWIDQLFQTGDWVLTCGWNMWQIVRDN
jgi:predicted small metal-binding protein